MSADGSQGLGKKVCGLCGCKLTAERPDDLIAGLCLECKTRPEARRFLNPQTAGQRPAAPPPPPAPAKAFSTAEKALIRKLHGYMPRQQLLDLLNERRRADLGEGATLHQLQELDAELRDIAATTPPAGDWGGMRKMLARARRDGVLKKISRQTIDDFAVVYSLTPVQLLRLKDVILNAQDEEGRHV